MDGRIGKMERYFRREIIRISDKKLIVGNMNAFFCQFFPKFRFVKFFAKQKLIKFTKNKKMRKTRQHLSVQV